MREIVRSTLDNNTQFAAIEWNESSIFKYPVLLLQSKDNEDEKTFNEAIEALYKKWLVGEDVELPVKIQSHSWDVVAQFIPDLLNQPEKNEYLARKARKIIQQHFTTANGEKFEKEIDALLERINAKPDAEQLLQVNSDAKAMDEKLRAAVAATRNNSLEQKWAETGIENAAYLNFKTRLNEVFDHLKEARSDIHHINYNTIAPKVEAAYVQSKTSDQFNDTRQYLILLQKEVAAIPLERWQKNELMDRLRSAFDHVNARHDAWRLEEDVRRIAETEALQKQYDLVIPQAVNSNFSDGFALLKELQEITNKSSIQRDKRDSFYTALGDAFTAIKKKADSENDENFELASKQVDLAISTSANTGLFKDARQILIAAQSDLREIRLHKKQKDELFSKLRAAFDTLNAEQDAYFNQKRKENRNQLDETLQQLKRVLARKKEGMETLYHTKSNIESKASIIKVDKNSDGSFAEQFRQKLMEVTAKVESAEKDIARLEKKIDKLDNEIGDAE